MNFWPDDENFLRPSFNPPVPAPDVDPDTGVLITVAYNPAWSQVLMGAVSQMLQFAAWQGTDDDKKLAVARALLLMTALQVDVATVPTPFWDDVADVDAFAPGQDQVWYGELVASPMELRAEDVADPDYTWQERIEDWVLAGFVAYASDAGAAIQFLTLARRFRMAFKTRDVGGIVGVFVDADRYGSVDTYSATDGITTFDVDTGSDDPTTIWVECTGDHNPAATPDPDGKYPIAVIRKQLTPGELVSPPQPPLFQTRYNPDSFGFEVSTDGGSTWTPAPQADPRNITYVPPPTGGTARCDAAERLRNVIATLVAALVSQLQHDAQTADVVAAFFGILTPFVPGLGIAIGLFTAILDLIIEIGVVDIEASFEGSTFATMLCAIDCNLPNPPVIDATILSKIEDAMSSDLNTIAATVTNYILNLMSFGGANQVMALATDTGDCSDCHCCPGIIDFTVTDGGFAAGQYGGGAGYGGWINGIGWQGGPASSDLIAITQPFIGLTVIKVTLTVSQQGNAGNNGWIAINGVHRQTWSGVSADGTYTYVLDGISETDPTIDFVAGNGGGSGTFEFIAAEIDCA